MVLSSTLSSELLLPLKSASASRWRARSSFTPQVAHNTLVRGVGSVFQWAAAHVPLAVQHVPDMPFADAAWPDVRDTAHMAAAVEAALTDPTQLGEVGTGVRVATEGRVDPGTFAALVPRIAATLSELHRDLPAIWDLAKRMYDSSWAPAPTDSAADGTGVAAVAGAQQMPESDVASPGAGQRQQQQALRTVNKRSAHRRMQQSAVVPPNFLYTKPANFQPQPPAGRPALLIPIVVHVMSYLVPGNTYGPVGVADSPARVDLWVRVANAGLKPANVQLFVQVRGRARYGSVQARSLPAVHVHHRCTTRGYCCHCKHDAVSSVALCRNPSAAAHLVVLRLLPQFRYTYGKCAPLADWLAAGVIHQNPLTAF